MILSRVKISPQQRYDLEDFVAAQAAARADSKYYVQKFLSGENLVLGGFFVSGIGLNQATVSMANAALIFPESSFDFSYFVSASGDPDVVLSDADLTDGARNYVEAQLETLDGVPLVKAFWDPEANSGLGQEFNQIVNTITDLQLSFVVSTGGFSGSPDRIPVCAIDTDGSGVIKVILDKRELFGRLGKPSDIDNEYSWGTKVEPAYALTLTGVSGVFVAGEEISIGSETATVTTGGGASISFNEPTGDSFTSGDSVTGLTSGATGTVNTVFESFTGVDKNLSTEKKRFDALATEIKGVKGTRFWWQSVPSLTGMKQEFMSTIAPLTGGARVKWDGSNLIITDDNLAPSTADNIAAIRLMNSAANLNLRRMDDGREVVTITVPEVPDAGTLTLDQDGNSIPIDWNDEASDIQSTWNGSGAYAATVSGSLAAKRIVITADSPGLQVDVAEDANTLEKSGDPVVATIAVKQGLASDSTIAIADGEVLYVDLPSPLASANYSGVGVSASNYKVAARGDVALVDSSYWLAYREGSVLVWRFAGELESGETSEFSDNIPQSFLDAIGLASEASLPSYSSNIRGVAQESLVNRIGVLTDAAGDAQEDRSAFLRSDAEVLWTGTELQFSQDLVLEVLNTKGGVPAEHTVDSGDSPIELDDGECVWVEVDRSHTSQILALRYSSVDAIPAQTQATKDVFVLFKRRGSLLYIPLHKQVLTEDQEAFLGASGSGGSFVVLDAEAIPIGVTSLEVTLPFELSGADYQVFAVMSNETDPTPQFQTVETVERTSTTFTVAWNSPTDSANYVLEYFVPTETATIVAIADNSIGNDKLAQMPAYTIKGNNTGSTADADDLTGTEATALLDEFVGDSGSGGVKGLVPAPAAGDAAAEKFLHADGTFKTPAVSGTVEMFTSDDTWVVPAGITSILVDGSGGGGGGAASQNVVGHGGGGGGGGSYYPPILIEVVPGNTLAITIGLGGGVTSADGGGMGFPGGNTSLVDSTAAQTLAIFKGGDPGLIGSNPTGGLGGRGYGEGGDGGDGGDWGTSVGEDGGYNDSNYLYQGGDGGTSAGQGGAGGGGAGLGDGGDGDSGVGTGYGSGGAGRRAAAGGSGTGGAGTDGFLRIRW